MSREKLRKIVKEELKEFDVAHLPSANSARSSYSQRVSTNEKEELQEDHLSDADKKKLDRYLRELMRRAKKVDNIIEKALAFYGDGGEKAVAIQTTLSDGRVYESIRHKLVRVLSYLQDEYPNYDWNFEDELNLQ